MSAAYFDLDGTLADTRADLCATVNHVRRDFGLGSLPEAEVLAHVGLGAARLLAGAIPELADRPEEARERFMAHYAEHALESVVLYPGVAATLKTLAERGWILGVNTAKPAFATRAILEKTGIAQFFGDAVVAGGDCPEMKPSALPLLECARRAGAGLPGRGDWMVGDNWTDVECAANAGVRSIFCEFGFGRRGDSRPDATVRSFGEIADVLGHPAEQ